MRLLLHAHSLVPVCAAPVPHAVCARSLLQARERARIMAAAKRSRALAAQRVAAGQVVAQEDAARVIQSGIRGALWRRRVKREAEQEHMFIGMKPQVGPELKTALIEMLCLALAGPRVGAASCRACT